MCGCVRRCADTLRLHTGLRLRVVADWTRDELIIVCALLKANDWTPYRARSSSAESLSELLNRADFVPMAERGTDFRSANSVQRKMYDFTTLLPSYTGTPTKGGRATSEVLAAFLAHPDEMDAKATALLATIAPDAGATDRARETVDVSWELDIDTLTVDFDFEADEGEAVIARHLKRERNRTIRARKLAAVAAVGLPFACEVCGFSFGATYGNLGDGYIEVHHVLPLHASGPTTTRLDDLALLCSNCHRMIHRARPWLTPSELRGRLRADRSSPPADTSPVHGRLDSPAAARTDSSAPH